VRRAPAGLPRGCSPVVRSGLARSRSRSRSRWCHDVPFDHERLQVYQVALDFFDLADEIVEHLPRGRGHLADQLTRASLSIVNNIAEGPGKFSKGDKRRYYLSAMGSSTECAAMLDVCLPRKLVTDETHRQGKQLLDRIVAMLTKLAKVLQDA
jgi:four helix bundle protein